MEVPSDASPASADTAEVIAAAPVTEAPAVEAPPQDAKPAESSVADEGAKEPASLLDVVRNAVDKPAEPEASPAPKDGLVDPAAPVDAEAKPDVEDDANLPFHNHPRWQAVLKERDAATAELTALQAPAAQYEQITGFMSQHDLQPAEVAEGFEVMALLKSGTPEGLEKVLAWFEPRVAYLRQAVGRELPDDLREKVEGGLVDEESAAEIARARAREATTTRHTERTREQTATAATAEAVRAATATRQAAAQGWEDRTKASDPDYSKKAQFVRDAALAEMSSTGTLPTTDAETAALLDKVYAQVNATLKAALPKPRTITPAPAPSSSATPNSPPTSMRGAIVAALAG